MTKMQKQIDFLATCDKLKSVERQTLLLDKMRQENSAEHSWHFGLLAMTLFEYCALDGVDLNRVLKMALVHDLIEIYAGDTPAMDISAQAGKEEREQEAADKLFTQLPTEQAAEFRELWEEFEAMQTPDARYAAAADCLQSFLNNYKNKGAGAWVKYGATAEMIRERTRPIAQAMPALWEFVECAIDEGVSEGWIRV